jgi:hypothetical protein
MFFSPCTLGAVLVVSVSQCHLPSTVWSKRLWIRRSTRSVTQFAQNNKLPQAVTDNAIRQPLKISQFTYRVQENKASVDNFFFLEMATVKLLFFCDLSDIKCWQVVRERTEAVEENACAYLLLMMSLMKKFFVLWLGALCNVMYKNILLFLLLLLIRSVI